MKKNVCNFDEEFIKKYDEDSNQGFILEVDGEYPYDLDRLHRNLPFLSEKIKMKKWNKLV